MMPVGDMITKPLNYIINGIFPLEAFYSVQEELPLVHIMTIHSRYLSSYLSGCIYINTYNSIPSLLSFLLSIYSIYISVFCLNVSLSFKYFLCAALLIFVWRGSTGFARLNTVGCSVGQQGAIWFNKGVGRLKRVQRSSIRVRRESTGFESSTWLKVCALAYCTKARFRIPI